MNPVQFIEKNVISELVRQGFDESVALMSANKAVGHYRRSASASAKGKMFDACLYIAKQWASKVQPKKRK